MSLEILKNFIFSIEGKDEFRNIMRKIKRERIIHKNEFDDSRKYIPLTFEAMLNYLYEQSVRKTIIKSINYDQKSHLLDENYHLRPKPPIKNSCVSDLNLMTELMSKHDLQKSGELHRSDSNSFY